MTANRTTLSQWLTAAPTGCGSLATRTALAMLDLVADEFTRDSLAASAGGVEFTSLTFDGKAGSMNYYTVDEFIAQGDRVVMVDAAGARNKKSGVNNRTTPKVDILTIRRTLEPTRIVEFFELYDTAKALAAAGAVATSPNPRQRPQTAKRKRLPRKARKARSAKG